MTDRAVHDAVLAFEYGTATDARIVERSVRQEVGEISGDRTWASVARDAETVELTVEASDFIALRAGLNTWLTLVSVAERCAGCD